MNITRPITVLSFGGGQDSSAILYRLIYDRKIFKELVVGDLWVIMSDTGNEHPETYSWVENVRKLCQDKKINFVFLKAGSEMHTRSWPSLTRQWRKNSSVGTKASRKSCSDKLKIVPIYNFLDYIIMGKVNRKRGLYAHLERFGKIRVIIGIAKGEESRISNGSGEPVFMKKCVEKVYPLIDWGWDRDICQSYLTKKALTIPLPSNCMFCPFMSEVELLWLWRKYPDSFLEWVRLEQAKLKKWAHLGEKNLTVFGKRDLLQILEDAKEKFGKMTDRDLEVYKMSHGHCVKTKY